MPSVRLAAATHAAAGAWAVRAPGRRVVGLVRWALAELAEHPERAVARATAGVPSVPLGPRSVVVGLRPEDAAAWEMATAAVADLTDRPTGVLVRGLVTWRLARDAQRDQTAAA